MRVISGTARGRKLLSPEKSGVRPMLDRVKESLFNILQAEVPGARVLDLFSGTGSLGIEALSRGAERCVFIESDPELVQYVERNLERTQVSAQAEVIRDNVLAGLPRRIRPTDVFDLILCDPPYVMVKDPNSRAQLCAALERWVTGGRVADDAVLMIHHEPPPTILWPLPSFAFVDGRTYGRSALSIFRRR